MQFSIIGTGNMAWFLAHRLTMAGHQCNTIYGRDAAKAAALADSVHARADTDIPSVSGAQNDAVILAVPDQAIAPLAVEMELPAHTVLLHTAGSVEARVLARTPSYGVLWPVYSIHRNQLPRHREIPCAAEGSDPAALQVVRNLAHSFSDHVFSADHPQRLWMHTAAVIANNFINHLMTIDSAICLRQELPFSLLHPILKQTFERIATAEPAALQTGPAIRGDQATMQRHLGLLEGEPEWQEIYRAISRSIRSYHDRETE